MFSPTLHDAGRLCAKLLDKLLRPTKLSRPSLLGRKRDSHAASNARRRCRRLPIWRKHRSSRLGSANAPPPVPASQTLTSRGEIAITSSNSLSCADECAFLDFDGAQVAAGKDIDLGPSKTAVPDPAQVASLQASLELPSFIAPMPDRLPKTYELVKTLDGSKGHFNNPIHHVRRLSSGKQFIIKQVPVPYEQDSPTKDLREELPEAALLQDLDHENIIAVESVNLDYNGPFCIANIVLQYCDGGDIGDFVASLAASKKQVPVQFVQHFVSSILDAMLFMHLGQTYDVATDKIQHHRHVPVFHRDIKEKNIFLDKSNPASNGLPKILVADFGLASTEGLSNGVAGTRGYIAPEIVCGPLETSSSSSNADNDQVLQGTAGDWYAFGVTLYQIITGKAYTFQTVAMSRAALSASSSSNKQEILQLVTDCLRGDPDYRPQPADALKLHRLSAELKAGLQVWHDEGGRLPDDIWPEAFRFERVEQNEGPQSEADWAAVSNEAAASLSPIVDQAVPVAPQPYNGEIKMPGSSTRRRLARPQPVRGGLVRRAALRPEDW